MTGALNANDQSATNINVDSGSIDGVAIGANSASTASVTTLDIAGDVTVSGSHVIDMGANKLINVADPTSAQDAATKAYIESVIDTLNQKKSVKAATTENIVATYSGTDTLTATSTGVFVVDGVTPNINERVLVKDQTNGYENGIYHAYKQLVMLV